MRRHFQVINLVVSLFAVTLKKANLVSESSILVSGIGTCKLQVNYSMNFKPPLPKGHIQLQFIRKGLISQGQTEKVTLRGNPQRICIYFHSPVHHKLNRAIFGQCLFIPIYDYYHILNVFLIEVLRSRYSLKGI